MNHDNSKYCVACVSSIKPAIWWGRNMAPACLFLGSAVFFIYSCAAMSPTNPRFQATVLSPAVAYWSLECIMGFLAIIAIIQGIRFIIPCAHKQYALCCTLDLEGNLHVHPEAQEPMLANPDHTCLQLEKTDSYTPSTVVDRDPNAPMLVFVLQGFCSPHVWVRKHQKTRWAVTLDWRGRLCITNTLQNQTQQLRIPIFLEGSEYLYLPCVKRVLQLLAEEAVWPFDLVISGLPHNSQLPPTIVHMSEAQMRASS